MLIIFAESDLIQLYHQHGLVERAAAIEITTATINDGLRWGDNDLPVLPKYLILFICSS